MPLAGVGWAVGRSYERFHHDFRFVDYAFVAAIVAGVAYLLVRRRSRLAGRADHPAR